MKFTSYEALKIEPSVLEFWEKTGVYAKLKDRNKGKEKFYFLDGPPYTSGKLHIGHTWNYSMKDMVQRFKRMNGFDVWDRPGYDTHGLPTAHAVQAKFGLEHKEDIPAFGVDKFVAECKQLCADNLEAMKKAQVRLGVWMDFDNPYVSYKNSFIEGEWWLIKKANDNGRLYEGEKVMHWCSECSTALAKHELEYQNVADESIFLKFKLKGTENEYLVIWTTTPWTIPFNLGVMVNPDEDYLKAKVGDEVWVVASKLAGVFIQGVADSKYEVVEQFKGADMEGWEYVHPLFEELEDKYAELKDKNPNVHTVLLSKEYVETTSGSGLVHMAPGCGPEDYEVGHRNGVPPFNNLEEDGKFPSDMGPFSGWYAKKDDKKFISYFKEHGFLIESTPVEHDYAHCWRCKSPVVFRLTKQWFFKIEDLKDRMRELNKDVYWQPDWAGNRQFDSWLDNLRDNSITRQRYWGCPVPIWKCSSCDNYDVIGSVKELEEKSGSAAPSDLHIPHIDAVKLKCACGGEMTRVPDILDVWVDAGTTSWTCLDYPQREDLFERLWPADFILEGKDQIRGWFNLLFVASMVSMDKPSYKAVYMHGFINDSQGRKMSKSLGNYILPNEVIDKYGADTLRYYSVGGANPGLDLNYNFDDMKLKHKNLMVLWNVHKFLLDMANTTGKNPKDLSVSDFGVEEKYILSKLNTTVMDVTELFNEYRLNEIPIKIEELFLELSRTYIQLIRDKAAIGSDSEKEVVMYTIYNVLSDTLKMFSTIAPYITEQIYQNLGEEFGLKEESIHLCSWPSHDVGMIYSELESQMDIASSVIQGVLYAREKAGTGLRWPLSEAIVLTKDEGVSSSVEALNDIISNQTNVKDVKVMIKMPGVKLSVKPDFAKLGPICGQKTPNAIAKLATESAETILKHIEDEGSYMLDVDGEKFEISKECLKVEHSVPKGYVAVDSRHGMVYLRTEITPELEKEGYARELMRKVQSLRKDEGMQRSDSIKLHIKTDYDLSSQKEMIANKCGASELVVDENDSGFSIVSEEKVKGKEFVVSFEKV